MTGSEHLNFIGIDPGFKGAVGRISPDGKRLTAVDLPVIRSESDKKREFDLPALATIIRGLVALPSVTVGLEWPTTRPGEGAERSKRFGVGLGLLEGMLFIQGVSYKRIPPALWKGRLDLPGKTVRGANETAARFFDLYYPDYGHLIRGLHGGIIDGRLDALLIAHYLRMQRIEGMKGLAKQFGKGSDQALVYLLSGGKRRKKSSPKRLPLGDS